MADDNLPEHLHISRLIHHGIPLNLSKTHWIFGQPADYLLAGEVDDAATFKPVAARAAHLPAALFITVTQPRPRSPPRVGWEVLAFLPVLYRMGQKHITAVFTLHAF